MFFRRWLAGRLSLAVEFDLRNGMYTHLQRLSYGFFDRHQTGQLMSRATVDLQAVRIFLGYGLIFFTQHFVTVVVVLIALSLLNGELVLVAMAIAPVLMVLAYRYSDQPAGGEGGAAAGRRRDHAGRGEHGRRAGGQGVRPGGARAAASAAPPSASSGGHRAAKLPARYVPFMSVLPSLAIAGVMLLGGQKVINGDMTLGAFFAANGYMLLLVDAAAMVGMWVGQYQRAMASGERIFEVLDSERDIIEPPDARALPDGTGTGPVRARRVLATTTPARCCATSISRSRRADRGADRPHRLRQDHPDHPDPPLLRRRRRAGAGGRPGRAHATLDSLRQRSGSSARTPSCSRPRSPRTSPTAPPEATPEQICEAARAQAHEFICDLPDGYDTRVGERGLTLSGGQRQRIAIARALLMDPRILILDDATASVDASTEARIKLALREVMKGRTTLIIAHRLSTISMAERVVVLERGRIVAGGHHAVLMETSEVYRQIHQYGLVDRTFVAARPRRRADREGAGEGHRRGATSAGWATPAAARRRATIRRMTSLSATRARTGRGDLH